MVKEGRGKEVERGEEQKERERGNRVEIKVEESGRKKVRKSAKEGRKAGGERKGKRTKGRRGKVHWSKTPTIDQKEEGTSLICYGTSNESLSGARGSVKQDSSRRLHTNGSEQLGVAQGELHHLRREKCRVSVQCTRMHVHTLAHTHPHNHTHTQIHTSLI